MPKYIITGELFEGSLTFEFDNDNLLIFFANESEMSENQLIRLHSFFPHTAEKLSKVIIDSVSLECKLVEVELTFENFWNSYDYKFDKPLALREWNKLNDEDKFLVLDSIPRYKYFLMCKSSQDKIYPERYLKRRRFEVDYKALLKK